MDAPEVVESRFESVTAYLGWDHDRLDETLCSVSSAVESGDFAGAAARYEEFELGLLRHVRIEEELLFPVFEARSGFMNGPTAVMRDEHQQVATAHRSSNGRDDMIVRDASPRRTRRRPHFRRRRPSQSCHASRRRSVTLV